MDDITFCMSDCKRKDCYRHPSNIQDRTIPHSYADFKGTETCPEKMQLSGEDATKDATFDCISRQQTIGALDALCDRECEYSKQQRRVMCGACRLGSAFDVIDELPSVQPTLYGYNIELLAYIARVMEKEGVTAEYAVRTFDDISRAVSMIIEEAQQKAEEMLYERLDRQTGGD